MIGLVYSLFNCVFFDKGVVERDMGYALEKIIPSAYLKPTKPQAVPKCRKTT